MCSPWTDLTRSEDGRVMCQICLDWKTRDQLYRDAKGDLWDVCIPCGPRAWSDDGQAAEEQA